MLTQELPSVETAPLPTPGGICFRNNLNSDGTLPTSGPYSQCPDIIDSTVPITNPQQTLSAPASWHQLYIVQPTVDADNYYYLRGINTSTESVQMQANLYYAPANLILHPGVWQNNCLDTGTGSGSVGVGANTNAIGVTDAPFVWNAPAASQGSDFYSFVARVSNAQTPNPIPTITSWLDMGALLTQNLNYGFRTTCHVDGGGVGWCHWLGLSIPDGIANPGQLQVNVSASGLAGCTVTLFANTMLANGQSLLFGPQPISSDTFMSGILVSPTSGYSSSLAVVCTNPTGQAIASGSTLTVAISYPVPPSDLDEAVDRKLIHSQYLHWEDTAVGIQPQPVVLVGETTFIVA